MVNVERGKLTFMRRVVGAIKSSISAVAVRD